MRKPSGGRAGTNKGGQGQQRGRVEQPKKLACCMHYRNGRDRQADTIKIKLDLILIQLKLKCSMG